MKKLSEYVMGRLMSGALVVAPIYLAVLLLLKGMKSLTGVLKPVAHLLPKWLPARIRCFRWWWCSDQKLRIYKEFKCNLKLR